MAAVFAELRGICHEAGTVYDGIDRVNDEAIRVIDKVDGMHVEAIRANDGSVGV